MTAAGQPALWALDISLFGNCEREVAYSVPCPASARMKVLVNDRVVPEGTAISEIEAGRLTFFEFSLNHGADPGIGTASIKYPSINRPLGRIIKWVLSARYSLSPPS